MSALKFGDYVQVRFAGRVMQNVYKVPQELVNAEGVWLVDEDSRLKETKVSVARREGEYFYIVAGLNEHDLVVTTPPEYPSEGMLVKQLRPENLAAPSTSISKGASADIKETGAMVNLEN
jgi:multidrug efflux pump subunit AcrA (membrane-fusion protein)